MTSSPPDSSPRQSRSGVRILLWGVGLFLGLLLTVSMVVGVAMAAAFPRLPDIQDLSNYQPKLPLRIFAADGVLLGEFGDEKRTYIPIAEIPKVMKDAVLAIEDARFYTHSGIDYTGLLRAALANLRQARSQGASTITMQVARNVYLSSEKTFTRKIYEVMLAYKLERSLSKDQILEIYMNQIFLGHRAYGFAAASETYFGKPLKDISIAEAAMLAGLPKAPSAYNPFSNPKRARSRQLYIIERMQENGFITKEQEQAAKTEVLKLRNRQDEETRMHAEHVAETVRQAIFAQYGDATYTRGLNVYTTISSVEQLAAYKALRRGILDFERRQPYRGPEATITLPNAPQDLDAALIDLFEEHTDHGDLYVAVVLDANPKRVQVQRSNGETLEITGEGLRAVASALSETTSASVRIRRGAVIRLAKHSKGHWEVTQQPEVEGALVAVTPANGSIRAMVGGFDFAKNKFNHVTQAWRQPGSSFKPFIYSASLEKGLGPATVINDDALFFDSSITGGQPWEPKNYDGTFEGPMSMRKALAKSKNMVSIRILNAIGAPYAQEWVGRFGFDTAKHPPYLTMALGAGSVTPLQMAMAYSVFANGGLRVKPFLITGIRDQRGQEVSQTPTPTPTEADQAIPARNAFVMSSLLQEVTRSGTAARAQGTLKRPDLYGKTGTTNDSMDAWFAGYSSSVAAVVWIGYDTPRKLGDKETGGGLALPIWISYMDTALRGAPVKEYTAPEGLLNEGGEWHYEEFSRGNGITHLSGDGKANAATLPKNDEQQSILDLFRQ